MDAILQRDEDAAVAEETGDCLAKKEGKQLWNNRWERFEPLLCWLRGRVEGWSCCPAVLGSVETEISGARKKTDAVDWRFEWPPMEILST